MEKTPNDILKLIEQAREDQIRAEAAAEGEAQREAAEQRRLKQDEAGELYNDAIAEGLIPDALRTYVKVEDVDVNDLEKYSMKPWYPNKVLEFHVPGLAPIAMIFSCEKSGTLSSVSHWLVAGPSVTGWDEDLELATQLGFSFSNAYKAEKPLLGDVLWKAQVHYGNLIEEQERIDRQIQSAHKRAEEMKLWKAEMELRKQKKRVEEEVLFNEVKHDPIAVQLLKTFVLLSNERSKFEQLLESAEEGE